MKKVYTLAAAMLVSGMAYAHTAERSSVVTNMSRFTESSAIIDGDFGAPAKKVNTKSTRAEDWKSLGEGIFRDIFFSNFYKWGDALEEIPVEIEQNVGDPTQYRLVNMYQNYDFTGIEAAYQVEPGENYVYINTYNTPDGKVAWWIEGEGNTGMYCDAAATGLPGGFVYVMWYGSNVMEELGAEEAYAQRPDLFGTFENGVFTAPAKCDTANGLMMLRFSTMEEGYGYFTNKKGEFAMVLPGVEMPAPPDPFASYTLIGECDMQNYILDNLFEEYTAKVAKVEVYEDQKGFFHVKNAWLAGNWNTPEQAAETDFAIDLRDPGFGIIDWQETGYYDDLYGSTVDYMSKSAGMMYYIADKLTKEQFMAIEGFDQINVYLDVTNKKIVIPGASMWYYLPDLPETDELYNALFSAEGTPRETYIQLPADYVVAESAVNEIASDEFDGPTRYFNLQGIEIDAPAKGDLVIKKNGSKSTKVIF